MSDKKMTDKNRNKGKKQKDQKTKRAEAPLAPLLKVEGPTDLVELTLTWEGGDAVLASLSDNGDSVDFGRTQGVGEAGLVLKWRSPDAFLHVLQWDLWFQGERVNLKATATINGGGSFENPIEADSKTDRWSASGTAE
ncbi:MAG TPA: hypothetical protein VEA16_16045, partial [Vicinamibacterales bacterium]|nr:hypothetical protein [Vicinamibacterales bacterium]